MRRWGSVHGGAEGEVNYRRAFLLITACVVSVLALSVAYRLSNGKPIFRPNFTEVRFLETWRSGRSTRDVLTRLSPIRHCLWVAVTRDELWVSPHFPFNLLFIPEVFHLDFRIPGRTIINVTELESVVDNQVRIRFAHATGDEDSLEVVVKDIMNFRKAVAAIRTKES